MRLQLQKLVEQRLHRHDVMTSALYRAYILNSIRSLQFECFHFYPTTYSSRVVYSSFFTATITLTAVKGHGVEGGEIVQKSTMVYYYSVHILFHLNVTLM